MTGGRGNGILEYLHRLARPGAAGEGTDGQLLEQFVTRHDQAAFATLLRRHGPLVWGVCRRLLRHTQDAEDSFQATFLILARKAGSVGKRDSVRSWLYGVAYRVAVRARTTAHRRRERGGPLEDVAAPGDDVAGPDLRPLLDEELARLPERYRLPLILCHLEGRTQEEAARLLGCPRATVATRLARGRDRLRQRLARRGLDVSAGACAAGLREATAPPVPDVLAEGTLRAVAAGDASPRAAGLAEGVLRTMIPMRWRTALVVLLALGVFGPGVGVLAFRPQTPAPAGEPRAEDKARPAAEPSNGRPAPAVAREGKEVDRRPPQPQLPRTAAECATRLAQRVQFDGLEPDPKLTLQEALDFLAAHFDLVFDVDEAAFKADGMKDVISVAVDERGWPKMPNVRLGSLLQTVLSRVPARSGTTFLLRDNFILVTTEAAVRAQLGRDDKSPLLPLVHVVYVERPLEEALRELAVGTTYSVVIDDRAADPVKVEVTATLLNAPLDTAVRVLADMAGLQPVRLDNVFYVTTPENAARQQAEQSRQPAPEPKKDTRPRPTVRPAPSLPRH
jgi:RNA polymerase sigma factor (sigma-70 family)